MLDAQSTTDSIVMIVDLHALTVEHDPTRLRQLKSEMLATTLACGVDPATTLCYVQSDVTEHADVTEQSDVTEHAELHYLLECAIGYGEAARMIQFRQKAAGHERIRLSLLTYPVLMAADILLHDADEVPVGEDQTQHIELARDVANRFNTRYGKMGRSSASDAGLIYLLDRPDLVRRKVSRSVTPTRRGRAALRHVRGAEGRIDSDDRGSV